MYDQMIFYLDNLFKIFQINKVNRLTLSRRNVIFLGSTYIFWVFVLQLSTRNIGVY